MSQSTNATPLYGTSDLSSEEAILSMFVRNRMMKLRTSLPVRIESVTNEGGVSPIGFVTIRPLVQQVDGEGEAIDHGVINNVPYFRLQGGSNAVIIDPEVGDIGMALFADRDMSAVKASKAQAPPGSKRHHNMADAVYMGTIIAEAPTQYIQFYEGGIRMVSPTLVRVEAPNAEFYANVSITGDFEASGGSFTHNGTNVGSTHRHGGITSGPSNTGTPT